MEPGYRGSSLIVQMFNFNNGLWTCAKRANTANDAGLPFDLVNEGDTQLGWTEKSNSTRTTSTMYGRIQQNFYSDILTYHQHPLHWSYPEVLLLLGFVQEIASLFPVPLWWLYHLHLCQTVRMLLWILQARDKWQTLNVKRIICNMYTALFP